MMRSVCNRNLLTVWMALLTAVPVVFAGAAMSQSPYAGRVSTASAPGKSLVARIGPLYGPDAGKQSRTLPVDVVIDYVPPAREPVVRIDLDEARRNATMVCLDCEESFDLSATRARRFSQLDDGMTLVVVLEVGNGMRGGRLDSAKEGLRGVLSGNYRQGRDRLTLVTIGTDFRVVSDFSANDAALLQAIDHIRVEPVDYPRLYWGMTQALQLFEGLDSTFPKRRRMLLISTGRNDAPNNQAAGAIRDNDVIEHAKNAQVTIDAIGIPSPLPARTISLVPPGDSGIPPENVLIPTEQSMDSFLDALEKIVRGSGGLYLRHDPHGEPIAKRLEEGLQWLKDTPVLTFELAHAVRRDGKTHRIALRIGPQPGRDFEAAVVLPAGWQWPYSTTLLVFVATLLVLSFVALLKRRSRGRQPVPRRLTETKKSKDGVTNEFHRNVNVCDDTVPDPGTQSGAFRLRTPGQVPASPEPIFMRSAPETGRGSTRVFTSGFPTPGPNSPCCTLRVLSGPMAGASFPMVWTEASIGRERERNSIPLLDPGISTCHARLRWNSGVITITDDHSTNGTRVGNVQLSPLRPHPLQAGDRIQIGSTVVVIDTPNSVT